MKAKEFLKSKGINYEHEATGMCAYVQNAGSTINAMEKLLNEYAELRLSNVVGQSELLLAFWDWYCKEDDVDNKYTANEMINAFLASNSH